MIENTFKGAPILTEWYSELDETDAAEEIQARMTDAARGESFGSLDEETDMPPLHRYSEEDEEDTDTSPWCNCGTCSPADGFPSCVRQD
jgi:hypothetical protein